MKDQAVHIWPQDNWRVKECREISHKIKMEIEKKSKEKLN